jgi:ABC-type polysaccharide/polyol phosphate transport system ATPase subunit
VLAPDSSEPAIAIDDVAKRFRLVHERNATLKATVFNGFRRTTYEEFWALDGVSFDVPRGSTFGIIGHNGSGKSTLLKCLAGIYRPDRGTITTSGQVSALLELGAGFHPELSGRENVYLNASILGMGRREVDRRFDDIVAFSGLERFIDSPVKNYSSGQFVRLGFAVAINLEPEIFLVDEVLAVGDAEFQQRCLDKFRELRAQGRTVVLVSHGLDTVREMCDTVAWIDHGHLRGLGGSDEVVDRYLESLGQDAGPVIDLAGGGWAVSGVSLGAQAGPGVPLSSRTPLRVEVALTAPETAKAAVEVHFYREDGVHVAGPRHVAEVHAGANRFVLSIESLALVAGQFHVSVRVLDADGIERAAAPHVAAFELVRGDADHVGGIVEVPGSWSVEPG